MKFAGSVMLGDLSDFIAPGQACVNPLFVSHTGDVAVSGGDTALLSVPSPIAYDNLIPTRPAPNIIKTTAKDATARVSLADCLACSGCVTSAEAVLIEAQSGAALPLALADVSLSVVVIFSPQALAALGKASKLAGGAVEAFARSAAWLRARGAVAVIDSQAAADIALAEAGDELLRRLSTAPAHAPHPWRAPLPSVAVATNLEKRSTQLGVAPSSTSVANPPPPYDGENLPLPLLASACPGWVCFAEKMAPEALPHMSTVRSAQSVTASLVRVLAPRDDSKRVRIFAIAPCYDKKLEAARRDFSPTGETADRDVDCVIAASEFLELLNDVEDGGGGLCGIADPALPVIGTLYNGPPPPIKGWGRVEALLSGLCLCPPSEEDTIGKGGAWRGIALAGASRFHSESDAWLPSLYRLVARVLAPRLAPQLGAPVPLKMGRNADLRDATLLVRRSALSRLAAVLQKFPTNKTLPHPDILAAACAADDDDDAEGKGGGGGSVELIFTAAYGFRNIQAVLSRLQRAAGGLEVGVRGAPLSSLFRFAAYAEVMACPSGCVNGGGLPTPELMEGGDPALALVAAGAARRARVAAVADAVNARVVSQEPHDVRAALLYFASADFGNDPSSSSSHHHLTTTLDEWRSLVRTTYHAVPPLEGEAAAFSIANKW